MNLTYCWTSSLSHVQGVGECLLPQFVENALESRQKKKRERSVSKMEAAGVDGQINHTLKLVQRAFSLWHKSRGENYIFFSQNVTQDRVGKLVQKCLQICAVLLCPAGHRSNNALIRIPTCRNSQQATVCSYLCSLCVCTLVVHSAWWMPLLSASLQSSSPWWFEHSGMAWCLHTCPTSAGHPGWALILLHWWGLNYRPKQSARDCWKLLWVHVYNTCVSCFLMRNTLTSDPPQHQQTSFFAVPKFYQTRIALVKRPWQRENLVETLELKESSACAEEEKDNTYWHAFVHQISSMSIGAYTYGQSPCRAYVQ